MRLQALRSACGQSRPCLEHAGTAPRSFFSTSQRFAVDDGGPSPSAQKPQPSARERSRAAAGAISSLANARPPSRVRTLSQPGPQQAPVPPGARVIDVRSLPRGGLRGRLQGPGGSSRGSRDGSKGREGNTGPSSRGGRFSGRGRGVRGGRGGRGASRRQKPPKEGQDGEDTKKEARKDDDAKLDPDEEAFDRAMRFGNKTLFNKPSVTLESLEPFMPAVPGTSYGRKATLLNALRNLAPGDPVGTPQDLHARHYAEDIEERGMRFFADEKARAAAEAYLQKKRREGAVDAADADAVLGDTGEPIIQDLDQATKEKIMREVVAGEHEALRYATDPVGLARTWHLRSETYSTEAAEKFENKLKSLLHRRTAVKGAAAAPR